MKARFLGPLTAATLLVACSHSKNQTSRAPASVSADAASTQPASPSNRASQHDIDLSTVEIRLDRTECYGWCPNYSVVISGNGHVQYIGRTFVREVGDREATLPPDTVRELLGQFETVGFADLQPAYQESVTDCPATYLTLRLGDRSKSVENYWSQGAFDDDEGVEVPDRKIHEQLDGLADAIDKAVNVERWIGTLEERKALGKESLSGMPGLMESK